MMYDCIFCKMIAGLILVTKIYETENLIVIADIAPKAPIHYLIIPKKHIADLRSCDSSDQEILGEILIAAAHISKTLNNCDFKLMNNNGKGVGQSVFHLHFHFLAGGGSYLANSVV